MKRGLKVLLIYPSVLYCPHKGGILSVKPHMMHLFSYLENRNFDVDMLDLEMEIGRPKCKEETAEFIKKARDLISIRNFDIVGISCWSSYNYLSTVEIARMCKEANSKATIVVGGYHAGALPSDFIYKDSPFDFIIRGEGEIVMEKICRGEQKKHGGAEILQGVQLDLRKKLGVSDWEGCPYIDMSNREVLIYLSRGCPSSCAFCAEKEKGHYGWRSFSVAEAIRKIEKIIASLNPKKIIILDACFGYDKRWRRALLSALIRKKIYKLFWAESRIDLMEKEDIDLLSKLNFIIGFGVESASEKMLRIMHKTKNPRKYLSICKDVIRYSNKKRFYHCIFLIFNHPGEDAKTYKETLQFFRGLIYKEKNISTHITVQGYLFTPGGHTFRNIKFFEREYGTIILNREWWKLRGDQYRLGTSVIASRDFIGKPDYREYWKKETDDMQSLYFDKMAVEPRLMYNEFWGRPTVLNY